jgi:choline dehydrogenase-like flavoprotein
MGIADARQISHGSEIETDLCIIGAGAAGLTMASELLGAPNRVLLLESGGRTLDAETQALYDGTNTGFPYYPPMAARLRFLGGTTNHWAGTCKPLDPIDFEARDWVPLSGWPIRYATLEPYYFRAHDICDLGEPDYDPESWVRPDAQPIPVDADILRTTMHRLSPPTRFGIKFAPMLEQASNITTLLHGNAVDLVIDESTSRISAVDVACLSGTKFRIKAGAFVLAMGALENTRFLLHCLEDSKLRMDAQAETWVGRCFMDHPGMAGGILMPSDDKHSATLYQNIQGQDGHMGFGVLVPSEDVMKRSRILNAKLHLRPTNLREGIRALAPGVVGATIAARSGVFFAEFGEHLRNIISELDNLAVYSYEHMFRGRASRGGYYLNYHLEQAPNRESTVLLSDKRDALGMRSLNIHWQLGELEQHTLRQLNTITAAAFGAGAVGRTWEAPIDSSGWPTGVRGAWHQMGTTRMSADGQFGVVDGNCKVHGVDNLYVAGSSVFSTSGHGSPTLTIVALAVRLAEHLRELRT